VRALKKIDDYCKNENIDCDVRQFIVNDR